MVRPEYAKTLQTIAELGADEFYSGLIGRQLIEEITAEGGIITLDDLKMYRAQLYSAEAFNLRDEYTLFSTNLTGSGILLGFILETLLNFDIKPEISQKFSSSVQYYHHMIEAFKYAYAKRSMMEDPNFGKMDKMYLNLTSKEYAKYIASLIRDDKTFSPGHYGVKVSMKEDHGTAHVSVVDEYGNVAAATSTINS